MPIVNENSTLTPAEQNPWYLLATLHGVPGSDDEELQEQNRVTWNRYYASRWTQEEREHLKKKLAEAELQPFSQLEIFDIRQIFVKRAGGRHIPIPDAHATVDYEQCHFGSNVYFRGFVFGEANFRSAIFSGKASFSSATFSGYADFDGATFSGNASFRSATFSGYAYFRSTTFRTTVIFTNAELKAPTDFDGCRFETFPPQFPGAKLHEGTIWRRVSWPRPPANAAQADDFTDAYERLKLEMDRLKKHEDELMFFAKELECRRVAASKFRGLPIGIYGVLCLYGQSYLRPLGWLLALVLVGAVQFWPVLNWDFMLSLGVSTANALGPLGLRKELLEAGMLPPDLSRWLRFFSGAQMVLGLVFLFLTGLGLRNRFRMK